MTTPEELPVLDPERVSRMAERLARQGLHRLVGTFVDSAGILRAKELPLAHAGAFHSPGLGAAPSWAVFAADDTIAFTPSFSPVGDMRLRVDLDAVADLGDGVAWAPIELADQDGRPLPYCARGALRRQQAATEALGIEVSGATEIEFAAFAADGTTIAGPGVWPAYGLMPLLDHAAFIDDVHQGFERAGLTLEQFHSEYGGGQFELSVAPATPLAGADANILARVVLGLAARRHGLRLSFSPQAVAAGIGNGAHVHLSFRRDGVPLLSGGTGPHELTPAGGSIVAGILLGLPESIAVLAPSALSSLRLQPGHWSGALTCWGLENREAALRLCAATSGNPLGAHLEIKCIDPSANAYAVYATLLGLAARGLAEELAVPAPVDLEPSTLGADALDAAGIVALGQPQAKNLDALQASETLAGILGPVLIEALIAVRRHEVDVAAAMTTEELVERFRFVWSA